MLESAGSNQSKTAPKDPFAEIVQGAQHFLDALRHHEPVAHFVETLAMMDPKRLAAGLSDDALKKAFWINLYNAFNLYGMRNIPEMTLDTKRKHFWGKTISIAGQRISLNTIEHQFLRRSQFWWARGYLQNPFPGDFEQQHRLSVADPRIHFALNCGANGCPAIRYYTTAGIEQELEIATSAFMATDVMCKEEGGKTIISASQIFSMYAGDFGGKRGILNWIKKYRSELSTKQLELRFHPYDWSINLDKFA